MSEADLFDEEDPGQRAFLRRATAFETTALAGGLVLFLALLYEMHTPPRDGGFLNPPLIAAAAVVLLWPLRRERTVRALMLAGGFLLFFWLLDMLSSVLVPFVLVYLLAFVFDPVVTYLKDRFGIPRWVSSMGVTALVVGLVALFVLLVVPNIVRELEQLALRAIESVGDLHAWLTTTTALDNLEEAGVIDKQAFINELTTALQDQLRGLTTSIPEAVQRPS